MTRIAVTLTDRAKMAHVPLAALGYALRRAGILEPLQEVQVPIKTVVHSPAEKLIEALVLILVGGRATSQADLLLRPNLGLAHAWGQHQFAQQATLADALDAMDESSLASLRTASEMIVQQWSAACHHDFRTGLLFLDDDLTGLPASRRAQGSTKGYFTGEKTRRDGRWRVSASPRTMKHSVRCCIPASRIAWPRSNRPSSWPNACWA
jgi:hypothetical protein